MKQQSISPSARVGGEPVLAHKGSVQRGSHHTLKRTRIGNSRGSNKPQVSLKKEANRGPCQMPRRLTR